MHRCFVEKEWFDAWIRDATHPVPQEVLERFFKILRVKENEEVGIFDGQGREMTGIVTKKGLFSKLSIFEEKPASLSIVILQAALEETKISETLKRGTEYGAHEFVIFPAERSDPFCFQKLKKRQERLKLLTIDASRQSGRRFVPQISFIETLSFGLKTQDYGFFGDLAAKDHLWQALSDCQKHQRITVAIGPEGGLSPKEIELLKQSGFSSVRWAPHTLRSELACLGAISLITSRFALSLNEKD